MATEDKHPEQVITASEVALAATAAIVGGPVGAAAGLAGVIASKLTAPLERRRIARERRFLNHVAYFLEVDDPEGAAEFVAENATSDEFADVLERGFEQMKRALDPLAEECICLLTAEHLRRPHAHPKEFSACGRLLESSDAQSLRGLETISSAYVEAYSTLPLGTSGILFDSFGIPNQRNAFFFVATYQNPGMHSTSARRDSPPNLLRLLMQMATHGFGTVWQGFGTVAPPELRDGNPSCRHRFTIADVEPMKRLHAVLAPTRTNRPG